MELYPEWLNYIKSESTKEAFIYIVGLASCLNNHSCHPDWHGNYRDFRFFDLNGEQPFAFGLAQNWLLFYFRPPAIRSNRYKFETIAEVFKNANNKKSDEWTVKLYSIENVRQLWRLLRLD